MEALAHLSIVVKTSAIEGLDPALQHSSLIIVIQLWKECLELLQTLQLGDCILLAKLLEGKLILWRQGMMLCITKPISALKAPESATTEQIRSGARKEMRVSLSLASTLERSTAYALEAAFPLVLNAGSFLLAMPASASKQASLSKL